MEIGSRTRDVDVEDIVRDIDDHSLTDELRSGQLFLVDSELAKTRHKVFNYAVETLDETIVNEKLDLFFQQFEMCSKDEPGFWFHIESYRRWGFRYFYAHENNTLLDRSKLVCTKDDFAKLKTFLKKTDVIESCNRERMNTKWSFYKLTNVTLSAVPLKKVSMGCKNAVLPKPLFKNHTINYSRLKRTRDNRIRTTCASSVRLLSIYTALNDWKKKLYNCSIYSSIKWMD